MQSARKLGLYQLMEARKPYGDQSRTATPAKLWLMARGGKMPVSFTLFTIQAHRAIRVES
jgi:hypothetical protein